MTGESEGPMPLPPDAEQGAEERPEAERPSPQVDRDLVRLMLAAREERTFWLPIGSDEDEKPIYSEEYYVKARQWTGVERDQYNAVGSTLSMPFEQPIGTAGRQEAPNIDRMEVTPDPVLRLRKLLQLTVTGYCLAPEGRKVDKPRLGQFDRTDWRVFSALHPAVLDEIREELHGFLGIEILTRESADKGEAPAPGS